MMMHKKISLLICCLLFLIAAACKSSDNKAHISGRIDRVTVFPCNLSLQIGDSIVPLPLDSLTGAFLVERACDTPEIVKLYGVVGEGDEKWPFIHSIYVAPGKKVEITLCPSDGQMNATFPKEDNNNNALAAYEQFNISLSRELWTTPPATNRISEFMQKFHTRAAEICEQYRPVAEVKQYLTIYGYLNYVGNVQSLPFIYHHDSVDYLPKGLEACLPTPEKVLDDPIALLFSNTIPTIYRYLESSANTPEEQIRLIREKFTQPKIVQHVTRGILQNYLSEYDYTQNFEEGLSRFKEMCAFLPEEGEQLIREFEAKRFSIEGAPLPDALLEDRNGKTCKLSDFKGKYLYIDLWASWCVPCCAEVPHLQQLEKQVTNSQVEFISISIDKNKKNWVARMEQLHMEGNQFIAANDELSTMLNISGIPHFLIYNKEGQLINYKAPRPSEGESLRKLLNGLK